MYRKIIKIYFTFVIMQKKYQSDIKLFKRLFKYVKPYWIWLAIGLTFTIIIAFIGAIRPMLIMKMVNLFILVLQKFIQVIIKFV